MKIADIVMAHDSSLIVLSEAGALYSGSKPSDIALQHVPQAARPSIVWSQIQAPDGRITALRAGLNGEIYAVIAGVLHRRVSQRTEPFGRIEPRWQEVVVDVPGAPPEPKPAVLSHSFRLNPGPSEPFELESGSYFLQVSSVVTIERHMASKWREIELRESRFSTIAGVFRVCGGSDAGGLCSILKEVTE
jgi:hypothetical protein